jgi:hypothetical protein
MPRSAGTYSLPANAHAVSGNTISSADFNAVLDDLANEMTNSLPRDGTASMSGVLKGTAGSAVSPSYTFGTDTNTGIYNYGPEQLGIAANGAAVGYFGSAGWTGNVVGNITGVATFTAYQDVASATTTDIGAATSNFVNITGTTTITGLGTAAAGTFRFIKFAGILTFTHNSTSLILPGGANITTAAGDTAEAVSLGSGNWRVVSYAKASGLPIVSPTVPVTGKIGQIVESATGAVATGTTTIPLDDTIPQNTEGDQYLSVSITPTSASSTLEIEAELFLSNSASGSIFGALFQDSTANALTAAIGRVDGAGNPYMICLKLSWKMAAGTTSATTFKVRAGSSSAGTTTFNGFAGGRMFGGVLNSFIRVREILP